MKIRQISAVPPGWAVGYEGETLPDGTVMVHWDSVIGLALTDEGEVVLLDVDSEARVHVVPVGDSSVWGVRVAEKNSMVTIEQSNSS